MAIQRSGFGPGGDKTRLTDRLDPISHTDIRVNFAKTQTFVNAGIFVVAQKEHNKNKNLPQSVAKELVIQS